MNDTQTLKRNYEAIGWGAIFVWWGFTELVTNLPNGTSAIGIGLILLLVNAARRRDGIGASNFSTTLGILALVWGSLELLAGLLNLPFELPVFAILLITLGVIVLSREIVSNRIQ